MRKAAMVVAGVLAALGCDDGDGSVTQILPEGRTRMIADQGPPDFAVDPDASDEDPLIDSGLEPDSGATPADSGPAPDAAVELPDTSSPDADPPPEPDAEPPPEPDAALPDAPNLGWIGGPCHQDDDCDYEEAFCVQDAEGFPQGMCSLDCDRVCPDRDGMPVTFCVGGVTDGGACVQRCDYEAFVNGCRNGYHCQTVARFGEADTRRGVCVPGEPPPPEPGDGCHERLDDLGLNYEPTRNPMDNPNGRQDLTCDLDAPVRLASPIAGVTYRSVISGNANPLLVACPMAEALHRLSLLLRESDVVDVGHIGTYNCRVISGTDSLSMHGLAKAIDLKTFVFADGSVCDVEDHWEHDTVDFQTDCGRWLYELGQEMFRRQLFTIILTPNYNAGHDNHFHVDLTPGARFIGAPGANFSYIGPNEHGD